MSTGNLSPLRLGSATICDTTMTLDQGRACLGVICGAEGVMKENRGKKKTLAH